MKKYINQARVITVKSFASASLIGLMSVGVAYAQGQSTVSINDGNSCKNQDYKNFDDVEIVETSDTQDDNLNNTNLVLNEIGYKVPAEHYINKR